MYGSAAVSVLRDAKLPFGNVFGEWGKDAYRQLGIVTVGVTTAPRGRSAAFSVSLDALWHGELS